MKNTLQDIKHGLPARKAVSFYAVPLCLGIALVSDAHLFAGIVVGSVSSSASGISGSPRYQTLP